ncbi:MAG TPA: CoA transferase [Solirubrobacteraceae bacterium]|jgi:formyl-CoA transferase
MESVGRGALEGLRVVEFAHVVAGPLAGGLMADLGADVVHVEPPGLGDTARAMGPARDGVHLWWKVSGRNKRSITIDLRREEGQRVARDLVANADVVITSLRADTLHRWGLDWDALHAVNRKLVMLQISGYGADTSMRSSPGFGKVGEARSGVVNLTGFPDAPPVHTGFSHGDAVTGLMGAFAVMAAMYRCASDPEFQGEWIDLALFEALFRLIEWQVIVHDQLGLTPERTGNRLAIAPAAVVNTYKSAEGEWITITSATQRSVLNVVRLLGLDEADYSTVALQAAGGDRIDAELRDWVAARQTEDALQELTTAEVVASRIFSVRDIVEDPIYAELGDIISIEDRELGPVRMQGVIPRLASHPGRVWRTGAALGEDNADVLRRWLDLDERAVAALREAGVIGEPPEGARAEDAAP